jgi:sugar phosphate isomerase/epimerase
MTGVTHVRCGLKRSNASISVRQDLFGLAYFAHQYKTAVLVEAGSGGGLYSPADAHQLISNLDPQSTGLALNSDCFAESTEIEAALPYVRAVVVSDFVTKDGVREWKPLGKGSVDFTRMFATLAKAGFRGPITVERHYKTPDEPGMLAKDAEFIRGQIRTAWRPVP